MEEEKKDSLLSINPLDVLSAIDGIPLPPAIKKSAWKAIGDLIGSVADVGVAKMEAISNKIRSESKALDTISKSASDVVSNEFSTDPYLRERAVNYYGSKLLKEQINREKIVNKAIDDIRDNPPKTDSSKEIDSDWLETFSRIAETKSNEDVQLFLSKILAGEIKSPGSFSQRTLQTLSLLDQNTAINFQSFCNISFFIEDADDYYTCVMIEPFGAAGANALKPVGLPYSTLTQLQDAGLVQYSLTPWMGIITELFLIPMKIGSTTYKFALTQESPKSGEETRVSVLNFTQVGIELRRVLHIDTNPLYNTRFLEWINDKFKVSILSANNQNV